MSEPIGDSSATNAADTVGRDTVVEPHPATAPESTTMPGSEVGAGQAMYRSSFRLWLGLLVGSVVSLPLAWLLGWAGTLMFFLGIFFFALFGLIIGAVVYRVAAPGRPYHRGPVIVGTTLLVASVWTVSMWQESRSLPTDVAADVANKTRDIGGLTRAEFETRVADEVRAYIGSHYSTGIVGYMHWKLDSGEFAPGDLPTVKRLYNSGQKRWLWGVRVVLTIGLLGFGVSSQTFNLRLAREPIVRAMDARSSDDGSG